MKIGIIGLGVVGSAVEYGMKRLGHKVFVHDTKLKTTISDILHTDICYICVPTPISDDGSCNVSIVESVIKDLNNVNYQFTSKEIKGLFHYINLEVYKIFIDKKRPPINREFLIEIRKRFDERKRSLLGKTMLQLPSMKQFETTHTTNGDCEEIIRSVRRGIKGVEKTLLNVSLGKFP